MKRKRKVKAATEAEHTARAGDRARRAMRGVVVFYVFVAGLYALWTPLGKGPDESAHMLYVEHLAETHRLPLLDFDPTNPDTNYEFHQPPLYYLLCLPAYLVAGGGPKAQTAARFCTLLLSMALVYLTFALARRLAPNAPWLPVGAAGVVAFLPMQLVLATSVGNDALLEVLSAASLLLMVGYLRSASNLRRTGSQRLLGSWSMAALGLIIGLGVLTKSIAVLLFPVGWVTAALAARRAGGYQWRQFGRDVALVTGVALLVCGWWFVLNQRELGDPLGQKAFLQAFEGRRPSPQSVMAQWEGRIPAEQRLTTYVQLTIMWTLATTLGQFGPPRAEEAVFYPVWVYVVYGLLGGAGALGFARYLLRERLADWQRQAWWVCGLFGALLLASFVRFNLSFFQAQARYLFPVLPAAAVAFCLGVWQITPARWRDAGVLVPAIALGLLALLGLPFWIMPRFLGA